MDTGWIDGCKKVICDSLKVVAYFTGKQFLETSW